LRLLVALLFCLVPTTTFAIPVQLSLSGTVNSKFPVLSVVDVGDPFSALLTYDIAPGATSTSVRGFLYYKNVTWSFTDTPVGITNGLPLGAAGEIFTEFNGGSLLDGTFNPPREFNPGRFSIVMSTPTTFSARLGFMSFAGLAQFDATGTVTPVPEPTTLGLLATGLAIGVARRLRKSRAGR
jgi:PEP-CTERM motif